MNHGKPKENHYRTIEILQSKRFISRKSLTSLPCSMDTEYIMNEIMYSFGLNKYLSVVYNHYYKCTVNIMYYV